jgi:predicted AAA+ superfamily ATPase
MDYIRRTVDAELDELATLPGIVLEGARGVGKTVSALQRARTTYRLDDLGQLEVVRADPARLTTGEPPILIDEWQRYPASWDLVRRAIDNDRAGSRFILTGSAVPGDLPAHSGAGRMVSVRMRPMSLEERGVETPTVHLRELVAGQRPSIMGHTDIRVDRYVDEILASGFPGLRGLAERALRAALDGYIESIVQKDFPLLGVTVRNPAGLRRWMVAYAAATATTASYERIRAAATSDTGETPAKTTTAPYADALESLWVVDPVPAWFPTAGPIRRVTGPTKHHLADPALAARLLNVSRDALLAGRNVGPPIARAGTLLASLFESLACLSVRTFAQNVEARVSHFRTKAGEREVDLIVESSDRGVVAIEVKLSATIDREDTKHLRWLREQMGDRFLDGVVISTGADAYRDQDGIAVVPLALLGA